MSHLPEPARGHLPPGLRSHPSPSGEVRPGGDPPDPGTGRHDPEKPRPKPKPGIQVGFADYVNLSLARRW